MATTSIRRTVCVLALFIGISCTNKETLTNDPNDIKQAQALAEDLYEMIAKKDTTEIFNHVDSTFTKEDFRVLIGKAYRIGTLKSMQIMHLETVRKTINENQETDFKVESTITYQLKDSTITTIEKMGFISTNGSPPLLYGYSIDPAK